MPYAPGISSHVDQIILHAGDQLAGDVKEGIDQYRRTKAQRDFNSSAFETILNDQATRGAIPQELVGKFNTMSPDAQSGALAQILGSVKQQRDLERYQAQSQQDAAVRMMIENLRIGADAPLRTAQTRHYNAESDAADAENLRRGAADPETAAKAIPTGVPGYSYVPGAKQVIRDASKANEKVVTSATNALNKQLAPFGLVHDDLDLVDATTPNVVRYEDATGKPLTTELAQQYGNNAFAVGEAGKKKFKIPLPKFQSFINQRQAIASLGADAGAGADVQTSGSDGQPAVDPENADNPLNDNRSPEQMRKGGQTPAQSAAAVDLQKAAEIKAQFKAGTLTREEAKAKLQQLGLQ